MTKKNELLAHFATLVQLNNCDIYGGKKILVHKQKRF